MTRVRIIYQIGPSTFTGKMALVQITKVCKGWGFNPMNPLNIVTGKPLPLWKVTQELVDRTCRAGHAPGRFIIYREPRRTKVQRSPYKQMLRTIFGVKLQPARTYARPAPTAPKPNKQRSRTVKLLEQELMQD